MKVAFFDAHAFEKPIFEKFNAEWGTGPKSHIGHEIHFFEPRLTQQTAKLARGYPAICAFVNDRLNAEVLRELKAGGTQVVALRSAGFNHVDIPEAEKLGIKVVRVPAYSPHAVAEHAVALILTLNRKITRSYQRVRELNFSLDGLVGFDLVGKTVGVIGTGKIGSIFAQIMAGFGCRVLAYDPYPNEELTKKFCVQYVEPDQIYHESDVLSLHLPLTPSTFHIINSDAFSKMKTGAMLINTGRGALIDTKALVQALKSGKIGSAGLDVYEEEENVFFQDCSDRVLQDDVLARLLTFPNVIITAHQAFLTQEALEQIVKTTLGNLSDFESGKPLENAVTSAMVK